MVERFVSGETKGGSISIEDEFCILPMSHDDVGRGVAASRKRKSPDIVGRRLGAIDACVVVLAGDGETITGVSSGVAQVNEGGKPKEVA
jgi:hypothetical protein